MDRGLGPTAARADLAERATDGAGGDQRKVLLGHGKGQGFAGPGGALPAKRIGARIHDGVQSLQISEAELALTVVAALIL